MAFPQTPLDVLIELFLSGAWTDITSDVYARDGIHIERGRRDEGARTDPGKCTLTLNNRSGKYSPRNPLSPYYGLIGRNTPLRVSVRAASVFLDIPEDTTARASTPDHASLDITGDIDVRADLTPTGWAGSWAINAWEVMGKYDTSTNQRSWRLLVRMDGKVEFTWSTTGSDFIVGTSTARVPFGPGRRGAIRATLDVDNGLGGYTVTFYTATTIAAGDWTQLGAPVVTTSGTTSVFASTTALVVGDIANLGFENLARRYHAAEVRNGIGGSVVAGPDFAAQPSGTTSFADSAGRTWTLQGGAAITNRRTRFFGEVSAWPSRWDVSGRDVYVPLEAAGILRRLGQGQKALESTLRRRIPTGDPLAYWPMEEGASATQASSPIAGVRPLRVSGLSFASDDSLPGSSSLPTLGQSSSLTGRVSGAAAGAWHAEMVYKLDALPSTEQTMLSLDLTPGTGGVARARARVSTAGIRVQGLDTDGAVVAEFLLTDANALAALTDVWNRLAIFSAVDGSQTYINVAWRDVITNIWWYANTVYTGTPGTVVGVRGSWGSDFQGMAIGHLGVFDVGGTTAPSAGVTIYASADDGFSGETAGTRMVRLATEEALPFTLLGDATLQERVGSQRPDTLLNLIEDAGDADGGILAERRDITGLAYRDRISLEDQSPALELDYTEPGHIAPPLEPVDDDQQVRNDVTVQRTDGSSGRAVLDNGPLSVQAPPNGVGRYDSSVTLNLYDDAQPVRHAAWKLHLGTWDEERYPAVNVNLAAAPALIDDVTGLESGDRITIANPPAWLPPGPIDLLVQGYSETIGHPNHWDLQLTCTPAGPWDVGVYNSSHRQTAGSELAAAVDTDDTTLTVLTTTGPIWTTETSDMPFDIEAGGERMTVSAIASFISDAFGRTSASSWGTADSGQAWQNLGGSASDFAVGSGYGSHTLSTLDVTRRNAITAADPDCDFYGSITTSALATGASLYGALTARMLDSGNLYMARLEFTTSNTVILVIRKIVADAQTELGAYTVPVTHVAGVFIRVRLQLTGSTLRAKAWPAANREPDRWHIAVTDTSITAANSLGTRSITVTGNTNVNPQIRYDDFAVVNPQRFTVTRSVNAIVKPHTAATPVLMYRPAVRALSRS